MPISDTGIALLRELEGVRPHMYLDSAGLPTVGVGHCLTREENLSGKVRIGDTPVHWSEGLTDAQIDALLQQDLATLHEPLEHIDTALPVTLTQHQRDCLALFIYNVGPTAFRNSTLLKRLQAGDLDAVPTELRRWVHSGGKFCQGLANRREREVAVWQGGTS